VHRRPRPMNQQRAEVPVAPFADASQRDDRGFARAGATT
jgi:hypothetical protein